MIVEIILSPIKDPKFNANIQTSEVWKNAFRPEEVTDEVRMKYSKWYKYHVKFDGLKPIQVTKFAELNSK